MAQKEQAKHRELYCMKCRGAALDMGDPGPGETDCLERQA